MSHKLDRERLQIDIKGVGRETLGVMPFLLTENQFSFTKGRQIAYCILVAHEILDSMKKIDGGGILLKLDFAKAYDNID